ncbi:TPA: hypothetical protein ACH3X2_010552 [Trebouxia sp. C0005]
MLTFISVLLRQLEPGAAVAWGSPLLVRMFVPLWLVNAINLPIGAVVVATQPQPQNKKGKEEGGSIHGGMQKNGVSVFRIYKGGQAFQQPIYLEGLQVAPQQQKSLFNTGFDLDTTLSRAIKANPDASYVQLLCTSARKAITDIPIVSSLADPRS